MKVIVSFGGLCLIKPQGEVSAVLKKMMIEKIESPSVLNTLISSDEAHEIVQRLYELGLRPGLEITLDGLISFGSVTVIQFGQTRLALNEQEMSCLHGR